jgi:hypothetical protein
MKNLWVASTHFDLDWNELENIQEHMPVIEVSEGFWSTKEAKVGEV